MLNSRSLRIGPSDTMPSARAAVKDATRRWRGASFVGILDSRLAAGRSAYRADCFPRPFVVWGEVVGI
jgi:hypothetical protein